MITTNGIDMINRFLAQGVQDWAGTIVVGALYTQSASTDTKLAYEISRSPITLKVYSPSGTYVNGATSGSNQIVVKASLDPLLVGSIYEVGIIPQNSFQANTKDNFFLTDFSETFGTSGSSDWVSGSSLSTASVNKTLYPGSRLGAYNISLNSSSVHSRTGYGYDLTDYNANDYLQILYYASGTSPNASVVFSFIDNSGYAWTLPTITLNPGASGYFTASTLITNQPSASFNYYVETISASTSTITGGIFLDSMKLMDGSSRTPEELLVSRTSSSAALLVTKYGQPTEIEYYLTVT
jgi:hypothetical protein